MAIYWAGDVRISHFNSNEALKALFRHVAIPTGGSAFYKDPEIVWKLPTASQRYVACVLFDQILAMEEQRRGYEERFEANAKKLKEIKLLMSISGIGAIRANQLAAIIVTPHRFQNKYRFYAYADVTKHKRDSDGKTYGRKRANGQPMLKMIFRSAVLGGTKSDTSFRRKHNEMRAQGASDKAARGAVARMIASTVLSVWKNGRKYEDKYREVTQRQNRKCRIES